MNFRKPNAIGYEFTLLPWRVYPRFSEKVRGKAPPVVVVESVRSTNGFLSTKSEADAQIPLKERGKIGAVFFFLKGGKGEVYDAKKHTQIYKYIHTMESQ